MEENKRLDPKNPEQEVRKKKSASVSGKKRKKKKKKKRTGLIVLCIILGVIVLGLAGVFIYLNNLRTNTTDLFEMSATATPQITDAPKVIEASSTEAPEDIPEETPVPADPTEYDSLKSQADNSMMTDQILNVLLIGIDYSEERTQEKWLQSGGSTSEHADVMIVLAINFDKQTVDMISLPRDTYTEIPDVQGFYKLNASLDCGGGLFEKDENGAYITGTDGKYIFNPSGLDKVCESCSWVLGGIPINYYYAVTMPAVKELVNAIGGVDYNLELTFSMQGRNYTKGQQHMDGQAVLDYLRVRKSGSMEDATEADVGDDARVNRQKDMLVAILNQLRSKGTLLKVPDILASFNGQLFTNCDFSQTAALALYAYDMPSENIRMHSMTGVWGETKRCANLHFYFLDQDKRVELIKQVYDLEVPKQMQVTRAYGYWKWADLKAARYLSTTTPLYKVSDDDEFRSAYRNLSGTRKNAQKTANQYLEGETSYLATITDELWDAAEDLEDAAYDANDGRHFDFTDGRIINDYNQIKVDAS